MLFFMLMTFYPNPCHPPFQVRKVQARRFGLLSPPLFPSSNLHKSYPRFALPRWAPFDQDPPPPPRIFRLLIVNSHLFLLLQSYRVRLGFFPPPLLYFPPVDKSLFHRSRSLPPAPTMAQLFRSYFFPDRSSVFLSLYFKMLFFLVGCPLSV